MTPLFFCLRGKTASERTSVRLAIIVSFLLLMLLVLGAVEAIAQQSFPCTLRSVDRSVTICRPVVNVAYNSPVRVLAGTRHTQPVLRMQVYVDGKKMYETAGDVADTNLVLSAGTHPLTVQAVDALGTYKTTMDIVVRAHPYPRYAYLTNSDDKTMSMFAMEAASGFVRENGYVLAGAKPAAVADNWRGFVYAAGGTDGKLYAYRKAYAGRLDQVAGSPYACGTNCRGVAVDATGNFVYAVDYAGNAIYGYRVNPTSGALTPVPGSPFSSSGKAPNAIVVNVRGVVLVTNVISSTLSAFLLDPTSGELLETLGSPIATGNMPRSLAVDPFGNAVYVANYGSNSISSYRTTSIGSISKLASPVATDAAPASIAVYPSGSFLYVTNEAAGTIKGYKLDINGKPSPIGTWATGRFPMAVAMDPQGKYVLVGNAGAPFALWVYSVNLSTGALQYVRGVRTHGKGSSLAMSSGNTPVSFEPGFLYAGTANHDNFTGKVFGFAIGATGALTALPGSPYATPTGTTALAAHPTGVMLYAPGQKLTDHFDGTVAQYWVNRTTGVLTATAPYLHLEEFESHSMVVEPSGRFAYATSGYGMMEPWFTGWSVPPLGGPLLDWLFYPGGWPWDTVSADPTGKFLFLDGEAAAIDPVTGALGYPPLENFIGKLVVDPTGRFAWGFAGDGIAAYKVNGITGKLMQVGTPNAVGNGAAMIAVDPYGKFVYVPNHDSNNVSAYKASPSDGSLTPVGTYLAGSGPTAASIDTTGRYLYVINATSLDISAYAINQTTGALTPIAGSPFKMLTTGLGTSLATIGKVK